MTAVLWDLDDTLVRTLPARLEALAAACETELGQRADALELLRANEGRPVEDVARTLGAEDPARFVATFRERFYDDPRPIETFEGITETLEALRAEGRQMAVVTSKVSWRATEDLIESGTMRYFAAIVGADDCDRHKPAPEPVFTAMQRLLVDDVRDVAFVGDSPADIGAARAAGCTSIGATWGTLDEAQLLETAPDFTARTPRDVLACVQAVAEAAR